MTGQEHTYLSYRHSNSSLYSYVNTLKSTAQGEKKKEGLFVNSSLSRLLLCSDNSKES